MPMPSSHEITGLLRAWKNGDDAALAELAPLVEAELHRLAKAYLRRERPGNSLQASDLVNEAYLRLIDWDAMQWQNRAHFFGIAAQLMRRILVDHARRRVQQKRGGEVLRVSFSQAANVAEDNSAGILAVDEALSTLASFDPQKSQIVVLKFFGGLSETEIAEVTQLSLRTVQREWNLARAWLFNELSKQ